MYQKAVWNDDAEELLKQSIKHDEVFAEEPNVIDDEKQLKKIKPIISKLERRFTK